MIQLFEPVGFGKVGAIHHLGSRPMQCLDRRLKRDHDRRCWVRAKGIPRNTNHDPRQVGALAVVVKSGMPLNGIPQVPSSLSLRPAILQSR